MSSRNPIRPKRRTHSMRRLHRSRRQSPLNRRKQSATVSRGDFGGAGRRRDSNKTRSRRIRSRTNNGKSVVAKKGRTSRHKIAAAKLSLRDTKTGRFEPSKSATSRRPHRKTIGKSRPKKSAPAHYRSLSRSKRTSTTKKLKAKKSKEQKTKKSSTSKRRRTKSGSHQKSKVHHGSTKQKRGGGRKKKTNSSSKGNDDKALSKAAREDANHSVLQITPKKTDDAVAAENTDTIGDGNVLVVDGAGASGERAGDKGDPVAVSQSANGTTKWIMTTEMASSYPAAAPAAATTVVAVESGHGTNHSRRSLRLQQQQNQMIEKTSGSSSLHDAIVADNEVIPKSAKTQGDAAAVTMLVDESQRDDSVHDVVVATSTQNSTTVPSSTHISTAKSVQMIASNPSHGGVSSTHVSKAKSSLGSAAQLLPPLVAGKGKMQQEIVNQQTTELIKEEEESLATFAEPDATTEKQGSEVVGNSQRTTSTNIQFPLTKFDPKEKELNQQSNDLMSTDTVPVRTRSKPMNQPKDAAMIHCSGEPAIQDDFKGEENPGTHFTADPAILSDDAVTQDCFEEEVAAAAETNQEPLKKTAPKLSRTQRKVPKKPSRKAPKSRRNRRSPATKKSKKVRKTKTNSKVVSKKSRSSGSQKHRKRSSSKRRQVEKKIIQSFMKY